MLSPQFALTVIVAATSLIVCLASEQHDAMPDAQIKCTCTPCGCSVSAPPPPPPPPPSLPPPSNPSSSYCPPPPVPPAPYLDIVGNPGNLYPVDPGFNPSNARRRNYAAPVPVFTLFGFLALLFFRD